MNILNLFKKQPKKSETINCKTCKFYGSVKSEDKLNPDKTVTRGKLEYEWCNKGCFYITEYSSCEYHAEGQRSARIMPPPVPKKKE
jgi:Pyruvate/2-oxoacid:ferredoxin oxidoreductase delta subunit